MSKHKILVVDDSPFMLQQIGDMLRGLDYEVTAVDNGHDACRMVEASRFDMIITDMNMPVMDGLELTRRVKALPTCRFVPVLMLSGEGSDEKIAQAKQIGVSTFLSKPLKEAQLRALLQMTLSKRRAPRLPVKLEVFFGDKEPLTDVNAGYSFNLSVGGLFLETGTPLSPGEKLLLRFSLPDHPKPISCEGRVAWVNCPVSPIRANHPPGMGVEFLNFDDERQLQRYLQSGAWRR